MRTTELWEVTCVCGQEISTTTPRFRCRICGRHGRMEWPHVPVSVPPDDTITAREVEG